MGTARLYRDTAVMSVGTALSRITGLARVAAMTYALGVTATRLADAYNYANTLPNIIYEVFLGGIFTSVFVPVLVSLRSERSGDPSALVSTSLLALSVASAVAFAAAPLIMWLYLLRVPDPATRAATQELATYLFRWFTPQILFYGVTSIAEALLNTRRRFGPPKFVPVLNNLVVIATFLAFARVFGEQGLELSRGARVLLGAGTTLGVAVQALALLPYLRGERLRFAPSLSDPAVRTVLRLSGFVLGYVLVNQAGLYVVMSLAAQARGGYTAYVIAAMFLQLPHGLFAVSLFSALLPEMSEAAGSGSWDRFRGRVHEGIRGVAYLLLPAAVGYLLLARPLTRFLLARGVASDADAEVVAEILFAFSVGLVFFSAFQFLTRCFYALQDTRTPALLNAVAVAVHSALNFPLFFAFGVPGLAMGHAAAYVVGTVLLARALDRRVPGGLGLGALVGPLGRIALAAAIMGAGVWATRYLGGSDLVRILSAVGGGAILYVAFSQVIGIPERQILIGWVRRAPTSDADTDRS
ncbi:MAG TPA: murein biosynthesis integral membrane protein MurJ [Actinomycetota bacterium]|nr:murein biosynthesis integral membrane protein MurJ [Actinomycetota bacterium]